MPSAYEGTDIISYLLRKYIIRLCRISYRLGDISFLCYGFDYVYPIFGYHYKLVKSVMNARTMNPSEPLAQRGSMISVPCGTGDISFDMISTVADDICLRHMKERILYHICSANISYGSAVYHIASSIYH